MASEGSTAMSLARKRFEMELMPPPPPPKRIKRPKEVLDEDTYTEALSQIIARDFFPGLLENETQHEYLDALESRDQAWINSAGRRLQNVMTPGRRRMKTPARRQQDGGQTPTGYVGDTPMSTISKATTTVDEKPEIDTNMSLGAFQAKYTSEDNESFYKLLDKQNRKKAEKYAWLWTGNKLPSKMQLKQKEIEAKLGQTRSLFDDGFKKDRLAIRDKDDRPAAPDIRETDPRNGLMFSPDGVDGTMETIAERAQAQSRAEPKSIVYENTRMPGVQLVQEEAIPPSPSLSAVRDAIAGRPRPADRNLSVVGGGDETPRVNGYAFVDDENDPEPEPASAPIMKLKYQDSLPNPFRLQEQSKREGLHHRMVERNAQSKRASARIGLTGKVDQTPVPKFPSSPRVSGGLTPAAQRLWTKIGTPKTPGSVTPFGAGATPKGKSSRLRNMMK